MKSKYKEDKNDDEYNHDLQNKFNFSRQSSIQSLSMKKFHKIVHAISVVCKL